MVFNFERVKQNIERVSSEGFLKHPKRKEFEDRLRESLEKLTWKVGWRQMHQEGEIKQKNLHRLANILVLADGDVEGWSVMDIGCGSPDEGLYSREGQLYRYYEGWLPYKAEILKDLGAKVVGVDYRPNPSASYEHRVGDFGEIYHYNRFKDYSVNEERERKVRETLKGEFDLVIGTSLVNDGLINGDSLGYDTLNILLGICAKPQQIEYFDYIMHSFQETRQRCLWGLKRAGINLVSTKEDSIGFKE